MVSERVSAADRISHCGPLRALHWPPITLQVKTHQNLLPRAHSPGLILGEVTCWAGRHGEQGTSHPTGLQQICIPYHQLKSAVKAVEGGTPVVIANGTKGEETILDIMRGKPVGTLVTSNGCSEVVVSAEQLADEGRSPHTLCTPSVISSSVTAQRGSQALQSLTSHQRASILTRLAALLEEREADILAANARDLAVATELSAPLRSRLSLSSDKISSLVQGLTQLAGT